MGEPLSPSEEALRDAAFEYHRAPTRGKISVTPTKPLSNQRDLSLAYSPGVAYPCLAIQAGSEPRGGVHRARQSGRRGHQRHRGARPRRHRAAGGQAGDGRQGLPVQEVRRHRRVRHRAGGEGPGQADRDHRRARADARRHQPRGHQGARVLPHRAGAEGPDEDPGLPRRPARHGDHLRRGAAQRARAGGQADRPHQAGLFRGRGGGDRLPGHHGGPGRAAREHLRGRLARRRAARARRRARRPARREQAALLPEDVGAHARRRDEGGRRVPRLLDGRRAHPGDGADHGRPADHPGARQPRAGDPPRARAAGEARLHRRDRPLGLPEPGQQRAVLPVHLPRCARLRRHAHHRGDEARLRARDRGAGQGGDQRRGRLGLHRPGTALRAGLHHSEAVRLAPHPAHRAGGGEGGGRERRRRRGRSPTWTPTGSR